MKGGGDQVVDIPWGHQETGAERERETKCVCITWWKVVTVCLGRAGDTWNLPL